MHQLQGGAFLRGSGGAGGDESGEGNPEPGCHPGPGFVTTLHLNSSLFVAPVADLGKARRVQVLDMVQRTVRFRVDKFGGYANLKDAMRTRFGERLVTNMAPGLGLIASLDDDLKTLRGD
jgi:hypothetical protein